MTSLVSFPAFDPNDYVLGFKQSDYEALSNNKLNPTLNRFAASFSPGSVMKPISAAVGLEHGKLNPNETKRLPGRVGVKMTLGGTILLHVFMNNMKS